MATLKLICLYGVILTWPVLGGLTLLDIIDLDFWLIMTIHAYFIIFHMMLKAKLGERTTPPTWSEWKEAIRTNEWSEEYRARR